MFARPIDRKDVFATGNYVAWFRGYIILPAFHFEFFVDNEIEGFAHQLKEVFKAGNIKAKVKRHNMAGNRQYKILTEEYRWVVENAPPPPQISAQRLVDLMEEHRTPVNAKYYDEMRKMIAQDLHI